MRLSSPHFLAAVFALFHIAAATPSPRSQPSDRRAANLSFEYIVVGSGAGGGPLASRLARAGHSVLLIEAGDDQGNNSNYTVPGFQAAVTEDPKMRWDIYVDHYQDQARAQRDPKYVYDIGDRKTHVGPNPPAGANPLGILYPRAGTLGGCASHNALIWITPHASDWDGIASMTGDDSWSASNMQQYLDRVYDWLPTSPTDPTILARDSMLTQHYLGGAAVMGVGPSPISALTGLSTVLEDPNAEEPGRDSAEGFYQIPLTQSNGKRVSVRDFIVDTVSSGYPLTVRTNAFVTKVVFDKSSATPRATGVEFLDGAHLYRASPLSGGTGTPGVATATKEVILAGGTYNTVQLLKLSGIGPKAELEAHNISTLVDSPGVGTNMQDRYEVPVNVVHQNDFAILEGCTFDAKPHDACYQQWSKNPIEILASRGAYATNGLAAAMAVRSDAASNADVDLFIFGGPLYFTGYFPGWATGSVADHRHFSWYTLKAHTRNTAGTVALRSADPLDPPQITFNYFDTGTTAGGADQLDLAALVQSLKMSRQALQHYGDYSLLGGTSFTEAQPGSNVTSDADLGQYVKDTAWGHHACCTAAIGADGDPNAVLDSQFRVRGTNGLRVVDASVFPKIPGVFIQAPIYMVAEKAADVILSGMN